MNLVEMFEQSVRRSSEKVAIRYQDRSITYGELSDLSHAAARVLQGLGVQPGSRVALMCFNTPYFIVGMLGALRLGAIVVPVNHKLQKPEVEFIMRHATPSVFIADGVLAPLVQSCAGTPQLLTTDSTAAGIQHFEDLVAASDPSPLPALEIDPGAPAQILYTSGTTGTPKGCLHSHRNVFLCAMGTMLNMSLTRDERMLIAMPIWHASPLNNWTFGTLLMCGTVVLLREYSPRGMLDIIERERTTTVFAAPVALLAPLDLPDFGKYKLDSMRSWIYGGGPLGRDMALKLMEAYGTQNFTQVYGMTEAGPQGTALFAEDAIRKAGSIGKPDLPGVRIRVIADDGTEVRASGTGEIQVKSISGMLGYYDAPEATANAYTPDGWYRSGDLVKVDEDGYMYVIDRIKDMIVTGGENVYSKEVEDAMAAHPGILEVAIVGRPHPTWGETIAAVIVPRPGVTLQDTELKEYLSTRLARYKIPREYVFAEALPRTPSGKLQKHLVRASLR